MKYLMHLALMKTTDISKFQQRSKNSVRLLAFMEARKGMGDSLLEILLELIEPTRKELGNIAYVPHRSLDNPDMIMFDELWDNEDAIDAHFKQPYMQGLIEKLESFMSKPMELKYYKEIGL